MAEEQQLNLAADLIRQKRYEEARRLLVTIDHPKAGEWLYRIDQIQNAPPAAYQQPTVQTYRAPVAQAPGGAYIAAPVAVVEEDNTHFGHVIMALIGGLIGAILGAAVWGLVAMLTEYEVAYIAILVGFLAGGGAVLFSGRRRGLAIQIVAVLCALVGIALGKYAAVYLLGMNAFLNEGGTINEMLEFLPPLSGETFNLILADIQAAGNFLDIVFVFVAVAAAFSVAAKRSR